MAPGARSGDPRPPPGWTADGGTAKTPGKRHGNTLTATGGRPPPRPRPGRMTGHGAATLNVPQETIAASAGVPSAIYRCPGVHRVAPQQHQAGRDRAIRRTGRRTPDPRRGDGGAV